MRLWLMLVCVTVVIYRYVRDLRMLIKTLLEPLMVPLEAYLTANKDNVRQTPTDVKVDCFIYGRGCVIWMFRIDARFVSTLLCYA